ncbi:hypothetical protein OG21DRAFT_1491173 [Imleria badia]|nr:hypothetical protein OG21DRAFT_1491173 [Imleria badia]
MAVDITLLEHIAETPSCVDREQMGAFMHEYNRSSDKERLLSARQEQLGSIRSHARQCENWQWADQKRLREERGKSIFERLKQLGYEPDVKFAGRYVIRESRLSLFNTCKPLTDKLRTVYHSRRRSLVDAYNNYVHHPSPDTPSFELLPHVADVARFPPFRDIIRAPEEISVSDRLFEPAFAQLPEFVDEWRKKLDAEVAELVQIPPLLSLNDTSGQVTTSSSPTGSESSRAPTDKLRLACALFRRGSKGTFTHPNVFSTSMLDYKYPSIDDEDDTERTGSIWDRFGIEYAEAAPYVVYTCGLDPNVATVEDMERRNARLQCLSCQVWCSYSWREAVRPLISAWGDPFCMARWRPIDDDSEEMQKIRAAELAENRDASLRTSRCLLCRPRVGDEWQHNTTLSHLAQDHGIKREDIKRGVHYMTVAVWDYC